MQKHREIAADRPVPVSEHSFRAGTHDHAIDVGDRYTQKAIAHRAAHFIDLHCNTSDGREG